MQIKTFTLCLLCLVASSATLGQANEQVGPAAEGRTLLPTRQLIRAAGRTLEFGGRPIDLALSPDGKTLYAKDNRGLVVVKVADWKVIQELPLEGGTSLHGVVVRRDGARVYATGAQSQLAEAEVLPDGALRWKRQILLPGPEGKGASYPCGLALNAAGTRAYVCLSRNNTLGVVDLVSGTLLSEIPVGVAPFDVALSRDGSQAYVSDWGGRRPKPGEKTAPSAGTETLVDARGVASSGCVSLVDLRKGVETAQIGTGLHPSDIERSADGRTLYVANANSDTVSVLALETQRVIETISVRPDPALPFGSMPNALALSPDDRTLYVANGGNNAISVVALGDGLQKKSQLRGLIPTGWYPGGIVTDGRALYIANIKGLGSRNAGTLQKSPKADDPAKKQPQEPGGSKGFNVYEYQGTLNVVTLPTDAELQTYTAQARADARLPQILRAREKANGSQRPVPVPARVGEPSVFEHIVYIIK
ncbi:MAG TPA: YncE family protein, partial [Chthonomonadaceae bacterium]|nr:YncE family protein [Chthonomonadaceae bacterium]